MNKTVLLAAAVAGALAAAMVLAAPQGATADAGPAPSLDRAAAYQLAQAD
jgi:hypothetical protein